MKDQHTIAALVSARARQPAYLPPKGVRQVAATLGRPVVVDRKTGARFNTDSVLQGVSKTYGSHAVGGVLSLYPSKPPLGASKSESPQLKKGRLVIAAIFAAFL